MYAYANGGSSSYTWTIYGSNGSNQVTTSSPNLNSYYVGCGGGFVQVQSTNSCGDNAYGSTSVPSCSGGGYYSLSVFPNPTSNEITVEKNSEHKSFISSEASFNDSVTLTLYDFSASEVKSKTYKEKSNKLKLDVSNLKKGNYFLKISGKNIDET